MNGTAITPPTEVRVELFGVPAILAACRDLTVRIESGNLAGVAMALAGACPALRGPVLNLESGWILGGYTFVVDDTFTRDPNQAVVFGTTVLLVSSVAGGQD